MSRKILFLDVDGVLNHDRSFSKGVFIDPECVILLNQILERVPDLDIVISSTWRGKGLEKLRFLFECTGLRSHTRHIGSMTFKERIIDVTGRHQNIRGEEIKEWLDRNPHVKDYVILDDDDDMLDEQKPFFVQTDTHTGLMQHHVDKIVNMWAHKKGDK